jgi:hypothetical protein
VITLAVQQLLQQHSAVVQARVVVSYHLDLQVPMVLHAVFGAVDDV